MFIAKTRYPNDPGLAYSLAGGFFFLRFLCPAIVFPEKNGVWEGEVKEGTRKSLTTISKALQRISTKGMTEVPREL